MSVIGIFTGKDLNIMRKEGGSGYWVVKSHRILSAKYALFIRNKRETWSIKDVNHGQAFMIGKISGCISAPDYPGRKIIQISEYSIFPDTAQFKNAWKKLTGGQRYPISYMNDEYVWDKLSINIDDLEWLPFESSIQLTNDCDDEKDLHDIILEAKEIIAQAANVDVNNVQIQINF